jgi:hypothetical protein
MSKELTLAVLVLLCASARVSEASAEFGDGSAEHEAAVKYVHCLIEGLSDEMRAEWDALSTE